MRFFSLQKYYLPILCLLGALAALFWGIAFYQSLSKKAAPAVTSDADPLIRTIILDPGHGGIDPGASSDTGVNEKDINLTIAADLKPLFLASGFSVVMTRSEDIDLSTPGKSTAARKTEDLKARLALFEQTDQSLVLSIHQNHFDASSSNGAQMFYGSHPFSQTVADSIQKQIVLSLQQDNTRQIKPITKDVYIIYHTTRPAVLCECGFLSNPTDAALLSDPEYCKELAFCIYSGVINALSQTQAIPQ